MKIQVSVKSVPASGTPSTKQVEVEATASVRAILNAAGLMHIDKLKVTVDGKVAGLDTLVKEGVTLTVTERPAGS